MPKACINAVIRVLFNVNKNSGKGGKLSPEFHWKVSS